MLRWGNGIFEGFVDSAKDSYHWRLDLPNFPLFEGAALSTSWNLKLLLDHSGREVVTRLSLFKTVDDFFSAIQDIVHNASTECMQNYSHKFYKQVTEEVNHIGANAIVKNDFSAVEFQKEDEAGRCHTALVHLPSNYPEEGIKIKSHKLPISQSPLCANPDFTGVKTLRQFYSRFCKLIEVFQPFWEAMEMVDTNCWVVEPQNPISSDTLRRIQISDSCSALLTLNPYNPGVRPAIEFRGAEEQVEKFKSALAKNLNENHWDLDVDINLNLLVLLDLDNFLVKTASKEDEFALLKPGECAICFEDRLKGQSANLRCDNELCTSQYHQECLLKYLYANPRRLKMMNAVRGNCPTCRYTIGCPILRNTRFQANKALC